MGCLYKILVKVLARRLKKVLSSVIDKRQSTFIGSRNIWLNVLVANEMVEVAKRCRRKCLVFKVDYERIRYVGYYIHIYIYIYAS